MWTKILSRLEGQMTKNSYASVFNGSRAELSASGQLIIYPISESSFEWMQNRLLDKIKSAAKNVLGKPVEIAFQAPIPIATEQATDDKKETVTDDLPSSPQPRTTYHGFTPLVDSLSQELGLIKSAIYGVVWRYCQMNSKTCYASQKTIADRLGIKRETVNRNLKPLLTGGYIRCIASSVRHEPNVYIVTNKVEIETGFTMKATVN